MDSGTVALVVVFPWPWPPPSEQILFSRIQDNTKIELLAESSGRLTAILYVDEHLAFQCTSRVCQMEDHSKSVVMVSWTPTGIDIYIDGTDVGNHSSEDSSAHIVSSSVSILRDDEAFVIVVPELSTTDAERLYLETILDIMNRLSSGSNYDLLRAAGLLRQLLLDNHPLVSIVNRPYRIPLEFRVVNNTVSLPYSPEMQWFTLRPLYHESDKIVTLSRDQFLRTRCLVTGSDFVTVRDFIQTCSNAMGGIHYGNPSKEYESTVVLASNEIRITSFDLGPGTIKGICQIVIDALNPLSLAIMEHAIGT